MLAVFAVDLATGKNADPQSRAADPPTLRRRCQAAARVRRIQSRLGEIAILHAPAGIAAERLLLVGLGKAKDFSLDRIRKGAGTAVRAAKPRSIRTAIAFPDRRVRCAEANFRLSPPARSSKAPSSASRLRHLSQRPQRLRVDSLP